MIKDVWGPVAVLVAFLALSGGAEWTISGLAQRISAAESNIKGCEKEIERQDSELSSLRAELSAENLLLSTQFAGLKATIDSQHDPSSSRRR